jgi:hypothetical protein
MCITLLRQIFLEPGKEIPVESSVHHLLHLVDFLPVLGGSKKNSILVRSLEVSLERLSALEVT